MAATATPGNAGPPGTGLTNGVANGKPGNTTVSSTRAEIGLLSTKVDDVLVLLLTDLETLAGQHNDEVRTRVKEANEIRRRLDNELSDLRDKLAAEEEKRESAVCCLESQLSELRNDFQGERDALKDELDRERHERIQQAQDLDTYFRQENEERKRNLDEINKWIKDENEKRMAESEALRIRMEREKAELREFMERDNKAMQERLANEEEERERREKELKDKLREQQEESSNEIILLHKRLAGENNKRLEEIEELNRRLADEKDFLRQEIENEKKDVVDRLKRENQILRDQLEGTRSGLKLHIDDNASDSNKKINDLAVKLSKMLKDTDLNMRDLTTKLSSETSNLKSLISKPLSVYFNAYRTEDYVDGGEDYLTFQGTHANMGGAMDAKSGVFTSPFAGAYLFIVHACTHDMNKGLMTIRRNGNQVASFYDQNHDSNHKNSMVGQSVILELEVGDKVQVYMFTGTGLQDKQNNHLTQFVGLFLRPKDFMKEPGPCPYALTNGEIGKTNK